MDQVPQAEVAIYARHKTDISFVLPIKVPAFAERHMDDGKHFTKSNLNVSYRLREVQGNRVTGMKHSLPYRLFRW